MSTKTQTLLVQYNQRLMAVIDTFQGEIRPLKENFAIAAARDLYQDTLDMEVNGGIAYLPWLEALAKFLKNPEVLAIDPDDKLEILADKILASPDLIAYFRNEIKPDVPLDRLQLQLFIKDANSILNAKI